MEFLNEFAAVPAITIVCMILAQVFKSVTPDSLHKHIPVLCGVLGCVTGVVAFIFIPSYIPAENVLVALAIGAVSGWAATGINQMKRQYENKDVWR